VSTARRLLGGLVTVAAATIGLVACSGMSEGTVVAKSEQGVYAYSCQRGGSVIGPVAVPVWGSCSIPECWRLVVRDSNGTTSQPCVSREEYDKHLRGHVLARTNRQVSHCAWCAPPGADGVQVARPHSLLPAPAQLRLPSRA
jgi:hypothetical protein